MRFQNVLVWVLMYFITTLWQQNIMNLSLEKKSEVGDWVSIVSQWVKAWVCGREENEVILTHARYPGVCCFCLD